MFVSCLFGFGSVCLWPPIMAQRVLKGFLVAYQPVSSKHLLQCTGLGWDAYVHFPVYKKRTGYIYPYLRLLQCVFLRLWAGGSLVAPSHSALCPAPILHATTHTVTDTDRRHPSTQTLSDTVHTCSPNSSRYDK